jgi:hypothetical protein
MNSNRAKRRLALVGLVLFSALALGIMSTQASNAPIAGSARVSGMVNPVAQIGSEFVTAEDFAAQVMVVQSNLSFMRGEIAAGNPSSAFL